MSKPDIAPPGVILLSAGQGSRMRPLTQSIPKSLLPVGDKLVLDWLVEAIMARTAGEIVVVTGFESGKVISHVQNRYGSRVTTCENERYIDDVNILSVEQGVSALRYPERGYLIVETDLLLDERAWDQIFDVTRNAGELSCWFCNGSYGPVLTGGIVHASPLGYIDAVDYQPIYSPAYEGWAKMVGLLLVGPHQVEMDRHLRRSAIQQTIAQYYLMPWREGIASLPSKVYQLQNCFARSFNTEKEFYQARGDFLSARHDALNNIEKKVM